MIDWISIIVIVVLAFIAGHLHGYDAAWRKCK